MTEVYIYEYVRLKRSSSLFQSDFSLVLAIISDGSYKIFLTKEIAEMWEQNLTNQDGDLWLWTV